MRSRLGALLRRFQAYRDWRDGQALRGERESGRHPVFLDYPVRSMPRYGHGRPSHAGLFELLNRNRASYERALRDAVPFKKNFRAIPVQRPEDPRCPFWLNRFFQGLDPVSLYTFACRENPRLYVEVGSGNSTKFIRRAQQDERLRTRIVSIDPQPRAEIDDLCDEIRREPLEATDLAVFDNLTAGDILLMDGSHRVFMNSDVSVFFLEILPRLRAGVLVYIDDIYLPLDYPPEWVPRYYSEQYMLAVLLLAQGERFEVVLPCTFVGQDRSLMSILDPIWKEGPIAEAAVPGNGFWLRVR